MATFHHIATDGWSMAIFFRELVVLYGDFAAGRTPSLPELPLRYADWAVWQRQALAGGALDAQLAYWRRAARRRAGAGAARRPPALGGHRRPRRQPACGLSGRSGRPAPRPRGRRGDHPLHRAAGRLHGAPRALSGQDDFAVGLPAAGRNRAADRGADRLLRQHPGGARPAGGRSAVRRLCCGGCATPCWPPRAHQDVPFERLVEELQPERDRRPHPALPGGLHLPGQPARAGADAGARRRAAGRRARGGEVRPHAVGRRERRAPERLDGVPHRPVRSRHRRALAGASARPARGGGGRPSRRLSELPLLSAAERWQLAGEWNATAAPLPRSAACTSWSRPRRRARPTPRRWSPRTGS